MKKTTLISLLCLGLGVPAALLLGRFLPGRGYYLTSTAVIILILIPFFAAFEGRRPQARELVLIAVLCALATAARAAFVIPHFKPMFGVIIIAGIALGAQNGFLVGAVSAFASNFFLAQGPWTPWQMLAYGLCGCIAGIFYYNKEKLPRDGLSLGLFGFVLVLFCVCPVLDTCSVFTTLTVFTPAAILSIYTGAILTNIIQAISTLLTLLLLSKPLLKILERIIRKYGLYS